MQREPTTATIFYDPDDATHNETAGILSLIAANTNCGIRVRGPGGGAADDEWIGSGYVQAFGPITNPVITGARTAPFVFEWSGPMIVDGTTIGT